MQIVIVGAGEVAYSLAETLLKNKHQVTIVEKDSTRCSSIAKLLNTVVINGDGTTIQALADAELDKADILIALTGRDQDNLIACQLASAKFHVPRTIARVRRRQNKKVFEKLGGVDTAVSTTEIISTIVEKEVSVRDMATLLNVQDGNVAIVQTEIGENSPAKDKHVVDLNLPENCVLTCLFREDQVIFPHGLTVLKAGDRILATTTKENREKLRDLLVGESSSTV